MRIIHDSADAILNSTQSTTNFSVPRGKKSKVNATEQIEDGLSIRISKKCLCLERPFKR
jgi:hypothetical protein